MNCLWSNRRSYLQRLCEWLLDFLTFRHVLVFNIHSQQESRDGGLSWHKCNHSDICMYVYMYMGMYVCIYVRYVGMYMCMYVCNYICVCMYAYKYICMSICVLYA